MPLYGVKQAGGTVASIGPGEGDTLFDGTETPANGLKSVAFSRGSAGGQPGYGATFYASGIPAACTVDIQGSNADIDGDYLTLQTLSPDANGNAAYTDIGYPAFYRATLSAYSTGAMPIVTVKR